MSPITKYGLITISTLVVIWLSLDIRKTSDENKTAQFDVKAYTLNIWKTKLPDVISKAELLTNLISMLQSDREEAFRQHGLKLGISKTVCFMARGSGYVESVDEENIVLKIENGKTVRIAVGFIFGNAIRDGSGIVNIDDFLNMTDFNNVSVELNRLVKSSIAEGIRGKIIPGGRILFAGAFELNENETDIGEIRIIPVSLTISGKENE